MPLTGILQPLSGSAKLWRRHEAVLGDASPIPFWFDSPDAPRPTLPLTRDEECDLAVVGAGFTGLWAALLAKEDDPSTDVVVLEAQRTAWAASGRNGGFCMATLTHGIGNGADRFPGEMTLLEELGLANLDEIEHAVARYGIDCDWERTGEMNVATMPWHLAALKEERELMLRHGREADLLDAEAARAEVHSSTYLGALWDHEGCAMVDPARLAWGLRRACLEAGVRLYEGTRVEEVRATRTGVRLHTAWGDVRACRAVLAANAFPALLRRLRPFIVPVYDYALMTEPLTGEQREAIGWRRRQGMADAGNQFHYYRFTGDQRVLWGGYDAVYYYGNGIRAELDRRPATFARLAEHFFATFPQLEGVRFTHAWGGVIDTCSRLCAFQGTAMGGRVGYSLGYTGMGVGESRFGARVTLDLLSGRPTGLTGLELVRTKPLPFPPEPLRSAGIQVTRWSLAGADRRGGRRNLWLRTLDRFGVGFDS